MDAQAAAPKMTRQEAGRKGGRTTALRYGRSHMAALGRKGGATVAQQRGPEYMSAIGRIGFSTTVDRHWQGDREGFINWLVARSLFVNDPYPANGAFQNPGPWPGRVRVGCIFQCGAEFEYDWKARTPDRCPECGQEQMPF